MVMKKIRFTLMSGMPH